MEGLSKLIDSEKRTRRLRGLKIIDHFTLTHLLFMEDILIFLSGSVHDIITLKESLKLFSIATGMEINREKSTISFSECSHEEIHLSLQNFPFRVLDLQAGLKYLGFGLKADGCKLADWIWLITKVEKRINTWCHHFHLGRED